MAFYESENACERGIVRSQIIYQEMLLEFNGWFDIYPCLIWMMGGYLKPNSVGYAEHTSLLWLKRDVHRGFLLQAEINQDLDMGILFVKLTFEM